MRSSADDVWMTYVPADDMQTTYLPADDMQMTFQMTYVIHQPNLQQNLTLVSFAHCLHIVHMSSAHCPHEISNPKIFPLKEQTALLKICEHFRKNSMKCDILVHAGRRGVPHARYPRDPLMPEIRRICGTLCNYILYRNIGGFRTHTSALVPIFFIFMQCS